MDVDDCGEVARVFWEGVECGDAGGGGFEVSDLVADDSARDVVVVPFFENFELERGGAIEFSEGSPKLIEGFGDVDGEALGLDGGGEERSGDEQREISRGEIHGELG